MAIDADSDNKASLRIVREAIKRLSRMQSRGFRLIGQAYQFVLESRVGAKPNHGQWQLLNCSLRRYGHSLTAVGLQWHWGHFHPDQKLGQGLIDEARAQIQQQGCRRPEQLLNLTVPLPAQAVQNSLALKRPE
jgi:hypothetical protein